MPDDPDTVTEALALLDAEGYTEDYNLVGSVLTCPACRVTCDLATAVVERQFRVEGPSDPADEALVLGIRCPECGSRGVLVSGFGPDVDPDLAELLKRL